MVAPYPSCTWRGCLQRLETCPGRSQIAGVSLPPLQWVMVPCLGLLGAAGVISGRESIKGEKPWVSFFVLIYSAVLVQTFLSLSLSFIFSKKGMTLMTFTDHRVPEKEKHTYWISILHWIHAVCSLGLSTAASHLLPEGTELSAFAAQDLWPPLPRI